MKKTILCLTLITGSLNLFGCESIKDTFGIPNRSPVISSFDYNPKSGISKNDIITFSVVANDPEGKPLQYNWTTSKGFLTGNAGSTVNWKPANQNNALEPGLSTVSVVVSDGIMTVTASVNIYVNPEGVAIIQPQPSGTPVPGLSSTPLSSVTPLPTATPTQFASPVPTATPTVVPSSTTGPTTLPTVSPTTSSVPLHN